MEAGADVNIQGLADGRTPLVEACQMGAMNPLACTTQSGWMCHMITTLPCTHVSSIFTRRVCAHACNGPVFDSNITPPPHPPHPPPGHVDAVGTLLELGAIPTLTGFDHHTPLAKILLGDASFATGLRSYSTH